VPARARDQTSVSGGLPQAYSAVVDQLAVLQRQTRSIFFNFGVFCVPPGGGAKHFYWVWEGGGGGATSTAAPSILDHLASRRKHRSVVNRIEVPVGLRQRSERGSFGQRPAIATRCCSRRTSARLVCPLSGQPITSSSESAFSRAAFFFHTAIISAVADIVQAAFEFGKQGDGTGQTKPILWDRRIAVDHCHSSEGNTMPSSMTCASAAYKQPAVCSSVDLPIPKRQARPSSPALRRRSVPFRTALRRRRAYSAVDFDSVQAQDRQLFEPQRAEPDPGGTPTRPE